MGGRRSWLRIDGTAVDWIYRDVDRVRSYRAAAQRGEFTFHAQVGHPLGVPDFAYAGELALAQVLADPTGELAALRQQMATYPVTLGRALGAGLDLPRSGAGEDYSNRYSNALRTAANVNGRRRTPGATDLRRQHFDELWQTLRM